MRAAVMSPFAISSAPIFIFVAISDASSADAGGRDAEDGKMDRGAVADGMGRCPASTEVTSLAAPRASKGAGVIAAAGPDCRPESGFEAWRFAAGVDRSGRTLACSEAGAT